MIVPAGTRKSQVSQGGLKYESMWDTDLFKNAQGAGALIDDPVKKPENNKPPADLQQATMEGGLNAPGQADKLEHNVDPLNQNPVSSQGIAPAGNGIGGSSPASQFLGQDPDAQEQNDPNAIWTAERQKIRSFIGNDFGMKLTQNPDGTFSVSLKPPGNIPVQDPTGFMDSLLQHIGGGTVNEEDTPAVSDAGGVLTLKYRPSGAGPQKISPKGKGRR